MFLVFKESTKSNSKGRKRVILSGLETFMNFLYQCFYVYACMCVCVRARACVCDQGVSVRAGFYAGLMKKNKDVTCPMEAVFNGGDIFTLTFIF